MTVVPVQSIYLTANFKETLNRPGFRGGSNS